MNKIFCSSVKVFDVLKNQVLRNFPVSAGNSLTKDPENSECRMVGDGFTEF